MTGYQPTPADIEILENAAAALDTYALSVRFSGTVPPEFKEWRDEGDKAHYDDMRKASSDTYEVAAKLQVALEAAQLKLPLEQLG